MTKKLNNPKIHQVNKDLRAILDVDNKLISQGVQSWGPDNMPGKVTWTWVRADHEDDPFFNKKKGK